MTTTEQAHAAMLAWSAPIVGAGLLGWLFASFVVPAVIAIAACIAITCRKRRR